MQEFLHDQSDCRILRHHVNRPRFLVVVRVYRRSAVFAVLPWRKGTAGLENKVFPCCSHILSQCIVRLVAEFRVTVSVFRRSKSRSPSCQSQRHGRGSPGQRLSLRPLLDYIYSDSGHRLKLKASTPDSLKAVVL